MDKKTLLEKLDEAEYAFELIRKRTLADLSDEPAYESGWHPKSFAGGTVLLALSFVFRGSVLLSAVFIVASLACFLYTAMYHAKIARKNTVIRRLEESRHRKAEEYIADVKQQYQDALSLIPEWAQNKDAISYIRTAIQEGRALDLAEAAELYKESHSGLMMIGND